MKYIFITGGVVSSLGKGLTSGALGALLEQRGLTTRIQKFDPYLNLDPGTMRMDITSTQVPVMTHLLAVTILITDKVITYKNSMEVMDTISSTPKVVPTTSMAAPAGTPSSVVMAMTT